MATRPLLADIVKGVVAGAHAAEVVGELENEAGLVDAVDATGADVVIATVEEPVLREPYLSLLSRRPRLSVLTLTDEGDRAVLWELWPRGRFVGDVSPDTLVDALRSDRWTSAPVSEWRTP